MTKAHHHKQSSISVNIKNTIKITIFYGYMLTACACVSVRNSKGTKFKEAYNDQRGLHMINQQIWSSSEWGYVSENTSQTSDASTVHLYQQLPHQPYVHPLTDICGMSIAKLSSWVRQRRVAWAARPWPQAAVTRRWCTQYKIPTMLTRNQRCTYANLCFDG